MSHACYEAGYPENGTSAPSPATRPSTIQGAPVVVCSPQRQGRRVLPESVFAEASFKGWSTPKSFNEAASGSPAAHLPGNPDHVELLSQHAKKGSRQALFPRSDIFAVLQKDHYLSTTIRAGEGKRLSDLPKRISGSPSSEGPREADGGTQPCRPLSHEQNIQTHLSEPPTRPADLQPLHAQARARRFMQAGSRIVAHSPTSLGALDVQSTRFPAQLDFVDSTELTRDGEVAWGENATDTCNNRQESSRLDSRGRDSSARGSNSRASESSTERQEIDGDSRPSTHQSKHSHTSTRHVQLGDDALVEEVQGEMAEVFVASKDEDEEETEGIMDSPEVATRKARLKEKMHQLATQSHDVIQEVDDHAFEKRAKLIRKRFKLMPWMVRERNMLWFAPPIEEVQGQSLGMFGFCVINVVATIVLAVRPAREAVIYEYDAFGEPAPAPYYAVNNVYFIVESIAFLTLAGEIVLAIVARGLLYGHYAFVKDPFNLLDCFILVISVAEFIWWALGCTIILRGFRVLRLLKPIMLLNVAEGCRAAVTGIRNSVEFVCVIFLIIFVIMLAFAAGLPALFGAQMHRRCVVEHTDTRYVMDRFNDTRRVRASYGRGFGFCQIYNSSTSMMGWLASDDSCPKQANALVAANTAGAGVNQVCDPLFGSVFGIPDGGFGVVDNIWSACLALLQASAGDSWQVNPYRFAEAEPKWTVLSWIIFGVPSLCCTLFLFQTIVALVARKYYETRLEQTTGKASFLNVMGNASTHQHHHHHHDKGDDSESISSESFKFESSETQSIGPEADDLLDSSTSPKNSIPPSLSSPKNVIPAPNVPRQSPIDATSPSRSPVNANSPIKTNLLKSPMQSQRQSPHRSVSMNPGGENSPLSKQTTVSKMSRHSRVSVVSEKSLVERVAIHSAKALLEISCILGIIVNNALFILELEDRAINYGNEGASNYSASRTFFTFFFMLEVVVRILESGSLYRHFRKLTSAVDFAIVFIDAAGMFAVWMGSPRWHVLRGAASVRLYRVMLILPASAQLLATAVNNFAFLMTALTVPVVFMVGCTIMTHHWFGEGSRFGEGQRFSYVSFLDAFHVMMHVSCGDKWRDIVFGSLQSASTSSVAWRIQAGPQGSQVVAYLGALFLVAFLYVMRYWFNGLFVGIVGECFNLGELEHGFLSQVSRALGPIWRWVARRQAGLSNAIAAGDKAGCELIKWTVLSLYRTTKRIFIRHMRRIFPHWDLRSRLATPAAQREASEPVNSKSQAKVEEAGDSPDYEVFGDTIDTVLSAPRRAPVLGHPLHTSLWVFLLGGLRYRNPIRVICRMLLGSHLWKLTINLTVLLGSIFVFIGETNRAAPQHERISESSVDNAYTVFTSIFIVEFCLHVIAAGLLFPPRAYLREFENIFDFIMLVVNLHDFRLETPSPFLRAILILRLLRLFRPPRPFRNGEGLIYHTVVGALFWLLLIGIFAVFLYLIFAIIGMELFSGQLHSCSCAHIKFPVGQPECKGNGISGATKDGVYGDILKPVQFSGDGFLAPCSWRAADTGHFDTLPDAILALARISARKWSDLIQSCMSIAGRGREPVPSGRIDVGLFFAMFIAVSAILIENLISAFMIQGFGRGLHFVNVSKEQVKIEIIEKMICNIRPRMPREWPQGRIARNFRTLIKNYRFRMTCHGIILIHAVLLLTQYGDMNENFQTFITYQNHVFFGLLCIEVLITFAAFGIKNFVVVPFHWLDVGLIALGVYSYLVNNANECAFPRILRVFRLFTVIAPKNRPLAYVNEMFHYSMGMVLQSLALFVIALMIFSLIGFNMFAHVRPGVRLGATANFDTFGMSIITLIQVTLGDEWHLMMIDLAVQPPFCERVLPGLSNGDCGTPFAPSFFLVYKFVVHSLCLNMVVASLIDGLQYSKMRRSTLGLYHKIQIESELRKFADHWTKFDPGSTRKMKVSIVPSFLVQLPKPLGFGKVSKLQKLSDFQRQRTLAITTELALISGLCDGLHTDTPVMTRVKMALELLRQVAIKVLCFCFLRRTKKKKKTVEEVDDEPVDYEDMGDRFWLLNASPLQRTYYPAGRVDPFWLNISLGETVSFEQVCTTVLAQMVPDYLSPERQEARAPLTKAVTGVLKSVQIAHFCRRCLASEDSRQAAINRRQRMWRMWSLSILNTNLGMIASITAMGFGTWTAIKPPVVAPPQLEAEKELEIANVLITNCEADLKVKHCDEKALTMTLLSLRKRKAAAQAKIDEVVWQREEEAREEEERRLANVRRVQQLCDKGHDLLKEAERQFANLILVGPIRSDTIIHNCITCVDEIAIVVEEADELFDKAIKAGAYYSERGTTDKGLAHGEDLRIRLMQEEKRCMKENDDFRQPLKVFANFVRLENADDFAMIHDHPRQRLLNTFFASVLLQAYARRKQERMRFGAMSKRSASIGGRFIPVSSKQMLALAPLNDQHQNIMAHRAGLASNRITLLRQQQLSEHLGFAIMSPTSPISHTSPLRHGAGSSGLDPHFVAEQIYSPRGMLYAARVERERAKATRGGSVFQGQSERQKGSPLENSRLGSMSSSRTTSGGSAGAQAINFGW